MLDSALVSATHLGTPSRDARRLYLSACIVRSLRATFVAAAASPNAAPLNAAAPPPPYGTGGIGGAAAADRSGGGGGGGGGGLVLDGARVDWGRVAAALETAARAEEEGMLASAAAAEVALAHGEMQHHVIEASLRGALADGRVLMRLLEPLTATVTTSTTTTTSTSGSAAAAQSASSPNAASSPTRGGLNGLNATSAAQPSWRSAAPPPPPAAAAARTASAASLLHTRRLHFSWLREAIPMYRHVIIIPRRPTTLRSGGFSRG